MAASPIPGASYMVSNMSSMSLRIPTSIFLTGSETFRSRLSGRTRISRSAMGRDVCGRLTTVNVGDSWPQARMRLWALLSGSLFVPMPNQARVILMSEQFLPAAGIVMLLVVGVVVTTVLALAALHMLRRRDRQAAHQQMIELARL